MTCCLLQLQQGFDGGGGRLGLPSRHVLVNDSGAGVGFNRHLLLGPILLPGGQHVYYRLRVWQRQQEGKCCFRQQFCCMKVFRVESSQKDVQDCAGPDIWKASQKLTTKNVICITRFMLNRGGKTGNRFKECKQEKYFLCYIKQTININ